MLNCKVRGFDFYICVMGHLKVNGITVKEFREQHKYSIGDECQVGK